MRVLCGVCVTVQVEQVLLSVAPVLQSILVSADRPFRAVFCRQPVLQEVRTVPFVENHLSHR